VAATDDGNTGECRRWNRGHLLGRLQPMERGPSSGRRARGNLPGVLILARLVSRLRRCWAHLYTAPMQRGGDVLVADP
jgi:hypothetical protein